MAETGAHVKVHAGVLDLQALADRVAHPSAGAVATFTGAVRDHHAGKAVSRLEYEAYVPMAEKMIADIAERAGSRWELLGIAVEHRIGQLQIGDAAVVIAVSAAHRGEAFEALRFLIDTLKDEVPIWKRETGPDGTHWIEGPDLVPTDPQG